jgi:hypothetical protein
MAMALPCVDASTGTVAEVTHHLREAGCALIRDAVPAATVDAVRAELAADGLYGRKTIESGSNPFEARPPRWPCPSAARPPRSVALCRTSGGAWARGGAGQK